MIVGFLLYSENTKKKQRLEMNAIEFYKSVTNAPIFCMAKESVCAQLASEMWIPDELPQTISVSGISQPAFSN